MSDEGFVATYDGAEEIICDPIHATEDEAAAEFFAQEESDMCAVWKVKRVTWEDIVAVLDLDRDEDSIRETWEEALGDAGMTRFEEESDLTELPNEAWDRIWKAAVKAIRTGILEEARKEGMSPMAFHVERVEERKRPGLE